jgi:transposase-like protein
MKEVGEVKYYTIGEVAQELNRIPQTLKNWIKWHEEQDEETRTKYPLPEAKILDAKGTRFYTVEDIAVFEAFKDLVKYGTMAEFSITRWGKRGQEIQQRKEESAQ